MNSFGHSAYVAARAGFALMIAAATPSAMAGTIKVNGVAAIAAAAVNPPDPVESCNRAKRNAEEKADKAGAKGLESWDRLSKDSDCSLTTQGKPGVGYFFIFTARGKFIK